MEQNLKELKSEVKCLLEEHPKGIKVNSFWTYYERKHHKLPDPKVFRVQKRSEILERCSDVFRRVGSGGTAVIHLKPSDQHQHCASTAAEGAVGGKEKEGIQPQTSKLQTSAVTVTPTPAGTNQFAAGGTFYQRFYAETGSDSSSVGRAATGSHSVTNTASHGTYSSLLGSYSRPSVPAAVFSNAPALYSGIRVDRFAVPAIPPLMGWNTPLASSSSSSVNQRYQTPSPRSRDSSASRSSDSARNQSPAPCGRQTDPRHQAVPTPLLASGRSSTPGLIAGTGVMAGRSRRTNYSRDQLNSAAEDCIDRLSVAKDYVSREKISRLLCQDFEVSSLDELGLRQIDELPCVNEHNRLECKVNTYIQNFVKVCWFHFIQLYFDTFF